MMKITFRWLLALLVVTGFAFSSNAQIIFEDDFETDKGWTLGGEFERDAPQALGGEHGNPDPAAAFGGTNVLGTDLTGLGANAGDYEANLADRADFAISPVIDCSGETSVVLEFQQYLNVESPTYDHAYIDISVDGGTNWTEIWTNGAGITDDAWNAQAIDITAQAAGQASVQIRFANGTSDGSWFYSGWNIDNFVLRNQSSETDFVTFSLPGNETAPATIDATAHTIAVEVAASADVTTLVATFSLSSGASAAVAATPQVSATTPNDFTAPVTYTVTAEDGTTTQDWMVTVTVATVSSETDITAFSFPEETGAATIDATAHTVAVEVAWNADVTTLTATFALSLGASAAIAATPQVSATTVNDFTAPVTYTVTAEDGTTMQDWMVTVTKQATPVGAACDNPLTAVIGMNSADNSAGDQWFEFTATENGNLTVTSCTYTTEDTRLWVYSDCPGVTEVANSDDDCNAQSEGAFSVVSGSTYYIRWGDNYTSNTFDFELVFANPNTETDILTYSFAEESAPATIDATAHTVTVDVVFGTDVSAITPTFTLSDGATTTQATTDFTAPVTYTVVAEDGVTTQDWTVTVSVTPANTENDILTYSFPEQTGPATIDATAHTVAIEVGNGTDVTALVATFTISDFATAAVAATPQVSTTTPNDFTSPVTYDITAEDGTNQAWMVTVTVATINVETDITAFSFPEETGAATIDATNHTIDIEVEGCTDVTALVATFTLSYGATVAVAATPQVSATTANDFTSPVTYDVTAEDGTTMQSWTVTVTALPAIVIDAFPWTEGFETAFAPQCWTNNTWTQSTYGAPYSGTEFAYTNTAGSELVTPELAIPASGNYELAYWYRAESASYPQDAEVLISTDGVTFDVTVQTLTGHADATYQQMVFDLSAYAGQSIWVKFVGQTGAGGFDYGFLVDDVQIDLVQSIAPVFNASNINVYPNPNNGQFNIAFNLDINTVNMEVVNAQGQVVANFNNIEASSTQIVNLTGVAEGMYFIRISSENETIVKKVNVIK